MSGDTAEQQAANEKNLETLHLSDDNENNAPPSEASLNGNTDNATNNDESDDDSRKLFVGGLSYETDSNDLRDYFSKWGKVTQSIIKFDRVTGYSRGFGFVTLESEDCVNKVLQVPEHKLHNRKIDPKRAKPSREPMKKIFVGGIDPDLTEEQIRQYFSQFGTIDSLDLPFDSQKGKRKNYIFVCFTSGAAAKKAIAKERQEICGKQCDVRLAVTREQASRQKAMKQYGNLLEQSAYFPNYAFADFVNAYASMDAYQQQYPPYYGYDLYTNPAAAAATAQTPFAAAGIYPDYSGGAAAAVYRGGAGASPIKPLNHQFQTSAGGAHHQYGLARQGAQQPARIGPQTAVAVHYAQTNGPPQTAAGQPGPAPVMDHEFSGMWQTQSGAPAAAYTRT